MFERIAGIIEAAAPKVVGKIADLIEATAIVADTVPRVALNSLPTWNGSKFPGGLGPALPFVPDYWTLRTRSAHLYETNIYARGVIRRLVTSGIATGLFLEAMPDEGVLGYPDDGLVDWSERVESRFDLWASNPVICDHRELLSFGELHQAAQTEAFVVGDVLCVLRQDQRTRLPRMQLINGERVQTPFPVPEGKKIVHGVELDPQGRHLAYWIRQDDGKAQRLPAYGEKSGRRISWLLYGSEHRMDDVRGTPLLSLMLQSLSEIDRYRDSIQRKASVLSMLAMFVSKGEPGLGSRPLTGGGGAARRDASVTANVVANAERKSLATSHIPGLVIDELAHGEEPKAFQHQGVTEPFGEFERAIISSIAWTHEIPPEVLLQSYDSNYSASQAALNDWKAYLTKARTSFGRNFCQHIYVEWLFAEVTARRIEAPGFQEAWGDLSKWDIFGAWTRADWAGSVKPSVDPLKMAKATEVLLKHGPPPRSRAARETNGTKFTSNVKKLERENRAVEKANGPQEQKGSN